MVTISLCMIVRDEEEVLARCLESVRGIPEEIILVDTGSKDKTKEIAGHYTSEIYDFPWIDDFSAARNLSFSKAEKDYILWLDADDILKPSERKKFLDLKKRLTLDTDFVMMPYEIMEDASGRSTFTYWRERLIRRSGNHQWKGRVHEAIEPCGRVIYEPIAVTHRKTQVKDPDRNLKIFHDMIEKGELLGIRDRYYYARELWYHGEYVQAETELKKFLSQEGWKEDRIQAWLLLAQCQNRSGADRKALESLYRSFLEDLPRAEVCCAIGDWYQQHQMNTHAIYWYETARNVPDQAMGFYQPDFQDFIPLVQICVCYDKMGEHQRAKEYHEQAKKIKPEHPAILHNEQYFQQFQ